MLIDELHVSLCIMALPTVASSQTSLLFADFFLYPTGALLTFESLSLDAPQYSGETVQDNAPDQAVARQNMWTYLYSWRLELALSACW
jgi:hypothetical protein